MLTLAISAEAEDRSKRIRRPGRRVAVRCGGDQMDGICGSPLTGLQCSADPLADQFDADCFSVNQLESPTPAAACETRNQPCEIHEAINRMGTMYRSDVYDNREMLEVILSYWDARYWDLETRWGAHGLDGYVVYSVTRNALKYRHEVQQFPTTVLLLEHLLRDHADRGLPTTADNGERWFHGGEKEWNTWSEDYMSFALGYASADAWFASRRYENPYYDEYRESVAEAVDLAFSISHSKPQTLRFETDLDPALPAGTEYVMIRNHNEYSPVYAMAIIARVWDINTVYRAASLPDRYSCSNVPENLVALYTWLTLKIEPNPSGPGYVFRSDGCERRDGLLSFCDDRPGDPEGSYGDQREPAHYALDMIMPQLCVVDHVEVFGPSCDVVGPGGTRQKPFNYFFNCVFLDVE